MADKTMIEYPEHYPPYKHQKEILDFLFFKKAFVANFGECGTGKTYVGVVWLHNLLKHKIIKRALVVCPKNVVGVWVDEFKKLYGKKVIVLEGKNRTRVYETNTNGIFVVNYELFQNLAFAQAIYADKPGAIVLDESHKIKNCKSVAWSRLLPLSSVKYKIVQTATPAPNSLLELFTQMSFLNQKTFSHSSYWHFRSSLFKKINNFIWIPKHGTKANIEYATRPISFAHRLEDITDEAPEIINKVIRVNMYEPKFVKTYAKYAKIVKDKKTLKNPFCPEVIKLRELASGFLYTENGAVENIHTKKVDVIKDYIEGLGKKHQVLIWANFVAEYAMLSKMLQRDLKYRAENILVLANHKQKYAKVEEFKNKKYQIMICNPTSIQYGLTINCKYVVWMSLNKNFLFYHQANMRVRRIGVDKSPVVVLHVLVKSSIDEIDYKALNTKDMSAKSYCANIRDHIKK